MARPPRVRLLLRVEGDLGRRPRVRLLLSAEGDLGRPPRVRLLLDVESWMSRRSAVFSRAKFFLAWLQGHLSGHYGLSVVN